MSTTKNEPYYKKQASYQDKRNVQNKANLIEPIIRHRIQDSLFYKQYLYLTNESTILPIIIDHVKYISGMDSSNRPSQFICCLFRMLEIEPSKEIIKIYLKQLNFNEFKYLTILSLLYIRLVFKNNEIYEILDEFYQDFRKIRIKLKFPKFDVNNLPIFYKISYIDEWIDELLINERIIDLKLPRLIPRLTLVQRGLITPRKYYVEEDDVKQKQQQQQDDEDDEDDDESSEYISDSD